MSPNEVIIRCPKCKWKPDGNPYWQCVCGHEWDIFQTGGRCPMCKSRQEETPCIEYAGGCTESSPHMDWYWGLDGWVDAFVEEEEPPIWARYGDVR